MCSVARKWTMGHDSLCALRRLRLAVAEVPLQVSHGNSGEHLYEAGMGFWKTLSKASFAREL